MTTIDAMATVLQTADSLGRKTARARHNGDESLAQFMREQLRKLKSIYHSPDREALQLAYEDGYRQESADYSRPL